LVVLVEERKSEEAYPGEDDQCHHVEPGANVGQAPEAENELDRVKHTFQKEKSAQLHDGWVCNVHQDSSDLGNLLWGDVDIHICQRKERVAAGLSLFHEDHCKTVDLDSHDDQEHGKRDVRDDCDEGKVAYRHKDSEDSTQNSC